MKRNEFCRFKETAGFGVKVFQKHLAGVYLSGQICFIKDDWI